MQGEFWEAGEDLASVCWGVESQARVVGTFNILKTLSKVSVRESHWELMSLCPPLSTHTPGWFPPSLSRYFCWGSATFPPLNHQKLRQAQDLCSSCRSLKCLFGRALCALAGWGLWSCSYSPVSVTLYFEPLIHQKGQEEFPLRRGDFWNSSAVMVFFFPHQLQLLSCILNSTSLVCCLMLIQRVSFAFYFLLLYLFSWYESP